MEQFDLILDFVYNNKNLQSRVVTRQELPKYQTEPNPTYWIDLPEIELNKNSAARANSLVDRKLSRPRIKFPK